MSEFSRSDSNLIQSDVFGGATSTGLKRASALYHRDDPKLL
jgi:hypothetical protein